MRVVGMGSGKDCECGVKCGRPLIWHIAQSDLSVHYSGYVVRERTSMTNIASFNRIISYIGCALVVVFNMS